MKHFRYIEPDERPKLKPLEPGELHPAYGMVCQDCGTDYSACVGTYWCPWCSEDF